MKDIDFWKGSIVKLPDSVFFDLLRTYLGDIKTPFHKPALVERLLRFVQNDDHIESMLQLISESEARVIAAIIFLDEPPAYRLFDLFSAEYGAAVLHEILVNLEERLIIFRDPHTHGQPRLYLTPYLDGILRSRFGCPDLLLPAHPVPETGNDPEPILTEALAAAVLTLFRTSRPAIKPDGSLKKKTESLMNQHISLGDENAHSLIQGFGRAFLRLGILNAEGVIQPDALAAFADLPPLTCKCALAAAFLAADGCLETAEAHLRGFLHSFPVKNAYTAPEIGRLFLLTRPDSPENGFGMPLSAEGVTTVVEFLIMAGYLIREPGGSIRVSRYTETGLESPELIVEAGGSIIIPRKHRMKDVLDLVMYGELDRYDTICRYQLNRESFLSGASVKAPGNIVERLESASKHTIPQSLNVNITSWIEQFQLVRVTRGIILTARGTMKDVFESTGMLKPYILEELAPGVYVMDSSRTAGWAEILKRTGFGFTDIPGSDGMEGSVTESRQFSFVSEQNIRRITLDYRNQQPRFLSDTELEVIRQPLYDQAERLHAMPSEIELIKELIRKKLVLIPTQIMPGMVRIVKMEARGMDYQGKLRIIDGAVKSRFLGGELVELTLNQSGDQMVRYLVQAHSLQKDSEGDHMLSGVTIPDETEIQLPVRKLLAVKRIPTSFFGRMNTNRHR